MISSMQILALPFVKWAHFEVFSAARPVDHEVNFWRQSACCKEPSTVHTGCIDEHTSLEDGTAISVKKRLRKATFVGQRKFIKLALDEGAIK
jgi:hypothetical protein